MEKLRVLVACECSGQVRDAFIRMGHDAISCDLQASDVGGPHYQGDVRDILDDGFDLMVAHPVCTYLAVTANKWLKDQPARKSGALVGEDRRQAVKDAKEFFMLLANANIPRICLENPVGVMSTLWRPPDQIICPTMFGHKEPKKTCLWLKNLPLLPVNRDWVVPERHITKSGKAMPLWYAYADKSGGQAGRAKIRSQTFSGVAEAMAVTWTNHLLLPPLPLSLFD